MKKTILAFGEVLWDILPYCTVLGGAPFNFAYRVNSLGDAGLMISRLGRDELGQKAFEEVLSLGMDTKFLQWDEGYPTGAVQVSFDEENNPDYVIIPGVAYDQIELTDELLEAASAADCLCFGTLSHINLRKDCYSLETVTFSLQKADVLKLNEDEAHQLGRMLNISHRTIPDFCEEISSKWSLKYCLVTLAESGAFAFSKDGEKVYAPGYKVLLADSLGSGDAFSAGFVHKILRQKSINQACQFGNVLGALVATKKGATPSVTLDEVNLFRNQNCGRNIHPEVERFANF